GGRRGRASPFSPREPDGLPLLNLLLDDLPGAVLVAGYAMQRHPTWTQRRIPVEHLSAAADVCAGWAAGATLLGTAEATGSVPTPTTAPLPSETDDPTAGHPRPALKPGSMRGARRLGVVREDELDRFDVHFRDSYVDRDGVEGAVHEYTLQGRFDP